MAIANPSPTKRAVVRVPPGYRSLYGSTITSLVLPPHSGQVLVGRMK